MSNRKNDPNELFKLAGRVSKARKYAGISQRELGKRAGYTSRGSITNIEYGYFSCTRLWQVSIICGVSYVWLKTGQTKMLDFSAKLHEPEIEAYKKGIVCLHGPLSERLQTARKHAGLSQAQLAKKAWVKLRTVKKIEAGLQQTSQRMFAIAEACGVSENWLKTGKGKMLKMAQKKRTDNHKRKNNAKS